MSDKSISEEPEGSPCAVCGKAPALPILLLVGGESLVKNLCDDDLKQLLSEARPAPPIEGSDEPNGMEGGETPQFRVLPGGRA